MVTLKQARAEKLLTVRGLAERAGVTPQTVHLAETGRSRPTFRVIRAISAALEVDPRQIEEFAAAIEGVGRGKAAAAGSAAAAG